MNTINTTNRTDTRNTANRKANTDKIMSKQSALEQFSVSFTLDIAKVDNYEKMALIENIRDGMSAGIEISKSLRSTAENSSNKVFADILSHMANEIDNGHAFTYAINLFPKTFPEYFRALIAAAEATGDWTSSTENGVEKPGILDLILIQLKRNEKVRSKVKGALAYPMFILGFVGLALLLITFFVLPQMRDFFSALDMEKNLNFASKSLLVIGDFIATYYYSIPVALIAFVLGIIFFWRAAGRTIWQKYCFDIPYILGKTIKKITLAETLSLLSTLIRAGVNATDAIGIIIRATTNPFVVTGLERAYNDIQGGRNFSESIRDAHPIFEKEAFQVISSAETTGQLDKRPFTYAQSLFNKAEEEIDGLIAILPSIMLVFVGFIVGFIVIAFYGSFFGAFGQLSGRY